MPSVVTTGSILAAQNYGETWLNDQAEISAVHVEGAPLDLVDLVLSGTLPLAGFPTEAELNKELAFELPPFYGVEDQLQQVFINLITNACHALPVRS